MRKALRLAAVLAALCLNRSGWADEFSPLGRWLTEDQRGAIEIYACGEQLCGRIAWQYQPLGPDGHLKLDRNNPSPSLRTHPLCGLPIMSGFRRAGADAPNEWNGGSIYDPGSGNTYSAKLTMKGANTMELRGYLVIPLLGQTQTWQRDTEPRPPCPRD